MDLSPSEDGVGNNAGLEGCSWRSLFGEIRVKFVVFAADLMVLSGTLGAFLSE